MQLCEEATALEAGTTNTQTQTHTHTHTRNKQTKICLSNSTLGIMIISFHDLTEGRAKVENIKRCDLVTRETRVSGNCEDSTSLGLK